MHKIPDDVQLYYCEHIQKELPDVPYMNLWAGDNVRFIICRLCSTMFLGTIVAGRIEEVANDLLEASLNVTI